MSRTALGPGRIDVSRVVLGCMWSPALREPEIHRLVHAACDHGITSFDTAPLYGFHRSEEILGRALRDRRDRVQILTKAGLRWDAEHGRVLFEFRDESGKQRTVRKDSRPTSLLHEVEASLRRLQVDHIDLLQIHHPDIDTPVADSVAALARLRDAGKVRAIGVSNYSPSQLSQAIAALGEGGLDSLQCEYNLVNRWPQRELLPLCRSARVGVLAYSPLAKGVLAGLGRARDRKLTAASKGSSYGRTISRALIQGLATAVNGPVAKAHGVALDHVALAWLLSQPGTSAVVCGASTLEQVARNAHAAQLQLSAAELARITAAFRALAVPLRVVQRLGG